MTFSSVGSSDPDGGTLTYSWVFGNGQTSTDPNPSTVYNTPGSFSAVLTVTDTNGFTASATVVITVQDVPPADPSGLTANAASATRVDLAWTDNSANETSFLIERSTSSTTGFKQIASVGASIRTYTDGTGLSSGKVYYYRVRAANSAGNSAYSNTASATAKR